MWLWIPDPRILRGIALGSSAEGEVAGEELASEDDILLGGCGVFVSDMLSSAVKYMYVRVG